MTHGQRRALKIICLAVLPAAVLAVDGWFAVATKSWTYSLRHDGAAVFWPGVLTLGVLCFPLAALSFGSAVFQYASTRGRARWPVAEGHVTGGSVEVVAVTRGKSVFVVDEYQPVVTYAYEVAGTTCSNQVPATRLKSREEADAVVRSYPLGATVLVHYDPDDPATSVLPIVDDSVFRSLGGTLILAAIPFVMITLVILFG